MNSKALILIYHGSRSPRAAEESKNFALNLQKQSPETTIRYAYLEIQRPSIVDVVSELYEEGLREFSLLPLFITAGKHVTGDVPEDLAVCREKFSDANFELQDHIGSQEAFAEIVLNSVN